jgi:hypothetical protein
MPKIVDVHDIRKQPNLVTSSIGVIGKVKIKDDKSAFFLLSDLNRKCKVMPIAYTGQRPEAGSEIIVYGQVKKVDRTLNPDIFWFEYFLEVKKIRNRKDIFSGNLFYKIRQLAFNSGRWFFNKCKHCDKFKKFLVSLPFYL